MLSENPPDLSPTAIRAWRGDRTRAELAALVGVTALTVYRWELPSGATEARSPRGKVAARVRAAMGAPPGLGEPEDLGALWDLVSLLEAGDLAAAEDQALDLMGTSSSFVMRTGAAAVLARLRIIARDDLAGAWTLLLPARERVSELPAPVARQVHLALALCCALPYGRLFDEAAVRAHLAAAAALPRGPDEPDPGMLPLLCASAAAFSLGDTDRVRAIFAAAPPRRSPDAPPLHAGLAVELQGHLATVDGQASLSIRHFQEAAETYGAAGFSFLHARVLTYQALRVLDDAQAPARALALAQQIRGILQTAGVMPGQHLVLLGRIEGESLLRLGRFQEAEAALLRGEEAGLAARWPTHVLAHSWARLYVYTDRRDALLALARRLRDAESPIQRAITRAYGALMEGWALLGPAEADLGRARDCIDRASEAIELSGAWLFFQREALALAARARVRLGHQDAAAEALDRLERFLGRCPSPWYTANARRLRGLLWIQQGRTEEGRQLLKAAEAAFSLAEDLPERALTARMLAALDLRRGVDGAGARMAAAEAEMEAVGMIKTPLGLPAIAKDVGTTSRTALPSLVVPLERLALRGVGPDLIARELVDIVTELLPGQGARLEAWEGDDVRTLAVREGAPVREWVEFGDGSGRGLRLGVTGPLEDGQRGALRALANVAGLALEVAALRGFAAST